MGWLLSLGSLFYLIFMVWMLVDCLAREQDKAIWLLVIGLLHPLGSFAYFLTRYVPRSGGGSTGGKWGRRDLRRFEIAAQQIGNAYHWIQLGDCQRELGKTEDAIQSYRNALDQESDNLQALWGLALCLEKHGQSSEALEAIEKILGAQADYKFGDVSLAKGRLLMTTGPKELARKHLEEHVKRWRQPEGLYRLAVCREADGESDMAADALRSLLMDLEASPPSIARQHSLWKKKARSLLRQL